mgnify:CR=1 FL=1
MNKETFKAGDEVYCPSKDFNIHQLSSTVNSSTYPNRIDNWTLTNEGKLTPLSVTPTIFHATPENKALLEALYKCEFESPNLKGSDLTRKLLSEGKHVLCGLSVHGDGAAGNGTFVGLIVRFEDGRFIDGSNNPWSNAVPCNDYANLVDGVLTLKSEQ